MIQTNSNRVDRWVIAQRWSQVSFLSFRCEVAFLREKIPLGLEIDTFDGSGWLSIVPFRMSHIRFPYTPSLPWISLWELNLRTYVTYEGRPGIYFFTLDTDNWLGRTIAKYCFHLPYRFRKMNGRQRENRQDFTAPGSFNMEAEVGVSVEKDALDAWLVERYCLYTDHKQVLYRGDALHEPWQLRELKVFSYEDRLSPQFGFDSAREMRARFSEPLEVRFRPFVKL